MLTIQNLIDMYVDYLHTKLNTYWQSIGGWDMDIIVNQDYVYADNEHPVSCVVRPLTGNCTNGLCELPIQLLFDVFDTEGIDGESLHISFKRCLEKLLNDIRESDIELGDTSVIQDYDTLVILSSFEDAGMNSKVTGTVNAKLQFHVDEFDLLTLEDIVVKVDNIVIKASTIQSLGFKESIATEPIGSSFSQKNKEVNSTSAVTMSFLVDKSNTKHVDLIKKGSYSHSLKIEIADGLLVINYPVAIRANLEYLLVPGTPCIATVSMIEGA